MSSDVVMSESGPDHDAYARGILYESPQTPKEPRCTAAKLQRPDDVVASGKSSATGVQSESWDRGKSTRTVIHFQCLRASTTSSPFVIARNRPADFSGRRTDPLRI